MRKISARVAAAVVALVAGAASYQHIASVALVAGEAPWVAYSLPFAIDGLIVVGVAALLEDKAEHRRPRRSAWLAVVFGVAATLAANVASAEPTWTGRLVAVAAPLSFLIAVEVLTRSGRRLATPDDTITTTDPAAVAAADALAAAMAVDNTPAPVPAPVQVSTPAPTPVTASASRSTGTRSSSSRSRSSTRSRPSAAERVRKAAADTPDATSAQIAARLGLSERTVQRYRKPAPAVDTNPPGDNPTGGGTGSASSAAVDNPTGDDNSAAVDNSRTASAVDSDTPDLFSANGNSNTGRVPLVATLTRN